MSNWKNRELDKKYYIVYKITNLINGKIYIGFHSTNDINDGYMGSGKAIKNAIKKHGKENFKKENLSVFDNQKEAEDMEATLVNEDFVNKKDTYNMTIGGNVCILKGENNGFYGKTHTKETLKKIQESRSWYKISEKTKIKISNSCKNVLNTPEIKYKMSKIRKGMKRPEETKEKISKSLKNKNKTDIHKEKISKSRKKWYKNMSNEEYNEWYGKLYTKERNKKISESKKGEKCPWNEKINKDPEKIRKTAEKHRGMKRSKETRRKISDSKKDKAPWNKGKKYYHNPETLEGGLFDPDDIPRGWIKGYVKKNDN